MTTHIFLAGLPILQPDPGLILWTGIVFLVVYILLGRGAFRPIQEALKKRENDIQNAFDEAKKAREELSNLQAKNQELLRQAQEERIQILKEAKATKESIINEAKQEAKTEASRIVEDARKDIDSMRQEAMSGVRNEVSAMALEISEKILRKKLQNDADQERLAKELVDEFNI